MYTVKLINVESIVETEEHIPERVKWLERVILKDEVWRVPLILEKKTLALMDGHHRLNAAKNIGLKCVPAILLDYYEDDVIVTSWRADYYIDRNVVLRYINEGKVFPYKTTKHQISPVPENVEIPLYSLY